MIACFLLRCHFNLPCPFSPLLRYFLIYFAVCSEELTIYLMFTFWYVIHLQRQFYRAANFSLEIYLFSLLLESRNKFYFRFVTEDKQTRPDLNENYSFIVTHSRKTYLRFFILNVVFIF